MARIRSIKPEFFLHEDLADLSPLHRLFFIGLWTLADKEGRLENRPKRIKASVLPWENCDVEQLIRDLDDGGFIVCYAADGKDCISIPGFKDHQRPHPKETTFNLPEPGNFTASREKKRQAVKGFSCIPSSPAGKEILESGKEIFENGDREPAPPPAADAAPPPVHEPSPVEQLQQLWNAAVADPQWRETGKARLAAAKARLKERSIEGPSGWREVIARIAASPFCRGKNDRDWRASPDWLLKPDTAAKVLEGKYDPFGGPLMASSKPSTPCAVPGCDQPGSKEQDEGRRLCVSHDTNLAGWWYRTHGHEDGRSWQPEDWDAFLADLETRRAS